MVFWAYGANDCIFWDSRKLVFFIEDFLIGKIFGLA